MSGDIVVRPLREDDVPAVLAIERASFSMPWSEPTFRGLLRREDCDLFAAEKDGEVLGYAIAWAVLDQAELGDIAVAEAWRRRGVGDRLLGAVLCRARDRGVRELFLEVRVSNEAARAFYDARGFRLVGRRPGYYSMPVEDALVLRKRLDDRERAHESVPEHRMD